MMYILVLLVVIALCSCTTTNGDMEERMVAYDSITISIDYPYISDYVQVHPYERADTLFMLGYNHWTHSIDMIDVSTNLKHNSIRLEKEGNNGVYNINSLLGAQDFMVIMELSGLKQVSFQGEVLNNVPLLDIRDSLQLSSYSLMNKGVVPGNFRSFAYNRQKNECYVPLTPLSDGSFENFCIGAKVNLTDGSLSLLDCPYPAPYNKINDNVGSYFHAQFSVLDEDRIIFNFYGNSHFWIYNQNTSEVVRKNMPSRFTENETAFPLSSGDIKNSFESEFTSLRFRTVHYVSSMDLFVRIHHAPKQDMLDKGNKHYLMLMSAKDDACVEYLLPSSFDGRYFVNGTCIYFLCRGSSDAEIRLGIIDLSKM